jgi:hypothetical protein
VQFGASAVADVIELAAVLADVAVLADRGRARRPDRAGRRGPWSATTKWCSTRPHWTLLASRAPADHSPT